VSQSRREFIALVGGAVAAWPPPALAQQPERIRRIGVLHYLQEGDPEGRTYVAAFLQRLHELGWVVDRNVRIDYRWTGGDADRIRKYTGELVQLQRRAGLARQARFFRDPLSLWPSECTLGPITRSMRRTACSSPRMRR
jgi:hypothetical protein